VEINSRCRPDGTTRSPWPIAATRSLAQRYTGAHGCRMRRSSSLQLQRGGKGTSGLSGLWLPEHRHPEHRTPEEGLGGRSIYVSHTIAALPRSPTKIMLCSSPAASQPGWLLHLNPPSASSLAGRIDKRMGTCDSGKGGRVLYGMLLPQG
jgi:hypothetical protein